MSLLDLEVSKHSLFTITYLMNILGELYRIKPCTLHVVDELYCHDDCRFGWWNHDRCARSHFDVCGKITPIVARDVVNDIHVIRSTSYLQKVYKGCLVPTTDQPFTINIFSITSNNMAKLFIFLSAFLGILTTLISAQSSPFEMVTLVKIDYTTAELAEHYHRLDVTYKTINATAIKAAVLVPKKLAASNKKADAPVVVHFHGGGLIIGTNLEPAFIADWYVR